MITWPKYVPLLEDKHIHRSIVNGDDCRSAIGWLWATFGVGTNQFKRVVNRLYAMEAKMKNPSEVGYVTAVILWEYKVSTERMAASLNQVFEELGYIEQVILRRNLWD